MVMMIMMKKKIVILTIMMILTLTCAIRDSLFSPPSWVDGSSQ